MSNMGIGSFTGECADGTQWFGATWWELHCRAVQRLLRSLDRTRPPRGVRIAVHILVVVVTIATPPVLCWLIFRAAAPLGVAP